MVMIAAGHICKDRLPVEKTDNDVGPLPAASPARLAPRAVGYSKIGRLALPGQGMLFVHERYSRFRGCRGLSPCRMVRFRGSSGGHPRADCGRGRNSRRRARMSIKEPKDLGSVRPSIDRERADPTGLADPVALETVSGGQKFPAQSELGSAKPANRRGLHGGVRSSYTIARSRRPSAEYPGEDRNTVRHSWTQAHRLKRIGVDHGPRAS